jgi:ferrochelatase
VFDQVSRYLLGARSLPELHLVRDYHDASGYIDALAASVHEHWRVHGRAEHLLLSFHGIPEANVLKGDPYARQCERTAQLRRAARAAGASVLARIPVALRSRRGVMPYTSETLRWRAAVCVHRRDMPTFAADCLETLEKAVEMRCSSGMAAANIVSSRASTIATITCA